MPNGVDEQTLLEFTLSEATEVSVLVYDLNGQLIKTVINQRDLFAGTHNVSIDVSELTKATYFVLIKTSSGEEVIKKMMKQ